jgi:hypothetical protein
MSDKSMEVCGDSATQYEKSEEQYLIPPPHKEEIGHSNNQVTIQLTGPFRYAI